MEKIRLGVAMCGSFCTFSKAVKEIEQLAQEGYDLYPIMSEISYSTDTRFGKAQDFIDQVESICERRIIHTIPQAEPIGPKKLLDVLLIMPCTGNTLGKIAAGITDTSVTLACKSHRRNRRPVVLAVSTNDALSGSGSSIGKLMNDKLIYFVPMGQDDPENKESSLVADFSLAGQAVRMALEGKQMQPLFFA